MNIMNKFERVKAAITGMPVDYVPSCYSLHFPKQSAFGEAAVRAHLDFYHETDVDILKVMNENLVPARRPCERASPVQGLRCGQPGRHQ